MIKRTVIILLMLFIACSVFAISPQASELLRKARVYLDSGNIKTAENYYRKIQSLNEKSDEINSFGETLQKEIDAYVQNLSRQAFVYMQEKNLPKAEALYKEILTFFPEDKEAISQLNEIKKINKKINQYKKQGIAFDSASGKSFDVNAYSAISEYNRAYAYFQKGDRAKALEILNQMLSKEYNYKAAEKLKEEIESIEELEKIIAKAESSFKNESMTDAIVAITELLERAPDRYFYYLMRAKAYMKQKNYELAKKDLFVYFTHTKDEDNVYPLMADLSESEGKRQFALGFAYNKDKRSYYKDFNFILRNYFYCYFWENSFLLAVIFILLPLTVFYAWRIMENFFLKFSIVNLIKTFKCFFYASINKINNTKDFEDIARVINYPWMNYFVGLVLLKNNEYVKAQRFFKFASNSINFKARASYFHGITSKLLNQKAYETDFDEVVITMLDNILVKSWNPWFMKRLEISLLKQYEVPDDDSLESMSHKLLSSCIY